MQYPNSLISKLFCSDLVGLIYSFIYQRCQRCKNIKDSDLFKKTKKNKIVQICNECSIVVKKIKTIKGELFNEIENQGNIRNGDILKIKFDRFMYDKALFEKTVNNYIRGRYAHLEYSIYDDMDEFYKVRIVDPNNIRYKTEQFFKRNFVNMKENPQTVFQLTQMEQPLNAALGNNFSNVKKLKIETEMFMYIMKKITDLTFGFHFCIDSNKFGKFKEEVDRVRTILMQQRFTAGDEKDEEIEKLAEKIEVDTMKIIDLPTNCTVLQFLKIIEANWPKMYKKYGYDDESYYIDSFTLDKKENGQLDAETLIIQWAC